MVTKTKNVDFLNQNDKDILTYQQKHTYTECMVIAINKSNKDLI